MGFSILDPHPYNECIDCNSDEAWFSFIFCGGRVDSLKLHVYDYYSGKEVIPDGKVYEKVPVFEPLMQSLREVGNGVRINIQDFAQNEKVFDADGEYTWRAELVQSVDPANGLYPDNMVYEGVFVGDPNFYATVDSLSKFDYSHYLPLTPCYEKRIKPPYYVDFLDSKYEHTYYDIPITYDEVYQKSDGTTDTMIRLDTYTSAAEDSEDVLRPAIGSQVYIHKKKNNSAFVVAGTMDADAVFIDPDISGINKEDYSNEAVDGCYLKVGTDYYKVEEYDKNLGIIRCKDGKKLKNYPAGTHYAIYTTHFTTPYYYFRVHTMPVLTVGAEFHEHRRLKKEEYDTFVNCLDNTFDGILFTASLDGDSHAAVKYHYWEIYDADTDKLVYKTEKMYTQEMDCELFVPYGHKYRGKVTVVTQDGVTIRNEVEYTLPASPVENDKRFVLRAIQNGFGGVELAWNYSYYYDGGSLWKATDYEVFREDLRLKSYGAKNYLKYLGKVDCMPFGLEGSKPALSGKNWYLFDKDCDFKLKTPKGAKVNMYLVGGGSDGGGWTAAPNDANKSFAVGQDGGAGGYFIKKSTVSENGVLDVRAKVAQRNDPAGTSLRIGGELHKCNDAGSERRLSVSNNTMTQTSGRSVVYNDDAEDGENGFSTPYGIVGSSGGGGAACGENRGSVDGGDKEINVIGLSISSSHKKENWILIDRNDLGGEEGDFTLDVPDNSHIRMYLVGGGSDGAAWSSNPIDGWDITHADGYRGGGGGYVLEKEIVVDGQTTVHAKIADRNSDSGTSITVSGNSYNCNDDGSTKTADTRNATAISYGGGASTYKNADNGVNGIKTPFGYVGSSGSGGDAYNSYRHTYRGTPGRGAGIGGSIDVDTETVTNGADATGYGCGGGGGAAATFRFGFNDPTCDKESNPGKGAPGCIILKIESYDAPCPDPGKGGIGAGDGGFPCDDGENAVRYGCGGGGAGYWADDSSGDYTVGKVGKGMQGCIIIEIILDGLEIGSDGEQVYAVDWTAASDKEYRYIVTACNYESEYPSRRTAEEMIECTAAVDVTPHFEDFYLYFLKDADVLVKSDMPRENYEVPLIEPLGRYVTSRNNPHNVVKKRMHTLALDCESMAFYRRHTWRIEGDAVIDTVTHNIVRNISPLYSKMPGVTIEPLDYDSFSFTFLLGYLECEDESGKDFVFNDQYMFELWKKCVYEKPTVMIKDPKGNIWTGTLTAHEYSVAYDTDGMPYSVTVEFTQTRTEHNTLIMIVDSHNEYLKTAKDNHLK